MMENDERGHNEPNEDGTVGEAIPVNETVDRLAEAMKLADTPIEGGKSGEEKPAAQVSDDKAATPGAEGSPAPAAPKTAEGAPSAEPTERVPDTWRQEAKDKWATVDPVVRAEIQKREADVAGFVSQSQEYIRAGQAVEKIVAPFMQVFQQYKVNPWDHVNGLLHAHYNMLFGQPQQKVQMLQQLCKDAGVDPKSLFDPNYKPPEGNEYVARLEGTVRGLQDQVRRLEGGVTGVTQGLRERAVGDLASGIMAFRNDKEAHPFFDDVIDECTRLISTGAAPNLAKAYEMAVYSDPQFRAKQQKLDQDKADAARQAKQATKAAAARRASGANVQSRGTGRLPGAGDETIHDTVANKLKEIRARDSK